LVRPTRASTGQLRCRLCPAALGVSIHEMTDKEDGVGGILDLSKLSENIVGLVDIIGRLAESVEKAIKSGIRSTDTIRQARERKRLRNFLIITAHLYKSQLRFVSSLRDVEDVGTWEHAKFEILEIRKLLEKIEKYVLPYNDFLVGDHRRQYLELLSSFDDRRKLLDFVYDLDYKEAVRNREKLEDISQAYETLMHRLQELALEFGSLGSEDEELWSDVTSAEDLDPLEKQESPKPKPKPKPKKDSASRSVASGKKARPKRKAPNPATPADA
jgi:hypothetical protein